ncbi:MAG: thioredoxin family protein [Isosphaeraceae bacterium]
MVWQSRKNFTGRAQALLIVLLSGAVMAGVSARSGGAESIHLRAQRGLDGRSVELKAPDNGASVLVFYSPECPISNAYSPTLNRLAREFPPGRVRFLGVCVDPDLSDADVAEHARDFSLKFPVIRDRGGSLAARLGATVTPEAFVIDPEGRIRYHGRIDDQFAGRQKPTANPANHELSDAVAAVLGRREVSVTEVKAVGCPIPAPPRAEKPPTYAREVSRIIQKNCQECHRKGQVGPFALDTYDQARKRADDIAVVVEDRVMPPWKPAPGVGPKFRHDRSLSREDIATLASWAAAGAPLGESSDMPPAVTWADDWALGSPDLIIEPTEDFAVPADGKDIYRCFVIPTHLPTDTYISAIEYRPGNRGVVHHMLSYVDVQGEARKKDLEDPGYGYECFSGPGVEIHGDLGGWAPGNEPSRLPDGIGRSLPKGADIIMQVHYHPIGKPQRDRSRIGLHFSRKPIRQVLHWTAAANMKGLKLPPGETNIEIKAEYLTPIDLVAHAVTPHMHLLGRDMHLRVTYPDGHVQDLVKINDWDFGWQNTYYFEKPIDLPKGSRVNLVAHYDNSAANPRNPNKPPRLVTWGEATTDEMCIGFIAVTKKGQDLTRPGEVDDLHDILIKDQRKSEAKDQDKESGKNGTPERKVEEGR